MRGSAQVQSQNQGKLVQCAGSAVVSHHQIFRFLIGKVLGKLGAFADDFVADIDNAGHIYVFARDGNNDSVDDVLRKERIVLRKYDLHSYGIFKTTPKGAKQEDIAEMTSLRNVQENEGLCSCVLPTEQDFGPVREALLAEQPAREA